MIDTLEQQLEDEACAATDPSLRMSPLWEMRPTTDDLEHRLMLRNTSAALFGHAQAAALSIGKYQVRRRLGIGGMGEVYLCEDPDLGREVALKRVIDHRNPTMRERLRREAQALARLNHRNVVQVYESGEHGGQLYIVMEYVEGQTLREWLAQELRSWREILAVFDEAGRGLAAAHAAGLVHRDFKPDNVLIGVDGIVRVADFGLAAGEGWLPLASAHAPRGRELPDRLSAAGSRIGTCAYMPLEQLRGEQVDARSDQFAFCMSLYEALWEGFAYDSRSIRARAEALEHGRLEQPRGRGDVFRVVRRGLERDPQRRWADMDALLAALARVPRRRRQLATWGAASLGLGLALGLGGMLLPARSGACDDAEAELRGIWDAEQRAQLDRRLEHGGLAGAARARTLDVLDGQASRWAAARAFVCLEHQRSGDDPAQRPVLQARERCLERERLSLASLRDGLADVAPTARASALQLDELGDPWACVEAGAQASSDAIRPERREAIEALHDALARVHDQRILGQLARARADAEQLVEDAIALDHEPTLARALAELAKTEELAGASSCGRSYERAISAAVSSELLPLLRGLYLELAEWSALRERDIAVAREHYKNARDFAAGTSLAVDARLAFIEGRLAQREGERGRAKRAYTRALELSEDSGSWARLAYLASLAGVVQDERASELRWEAVVASEAVFGRGHPRSTEFMVSYCLESSGEHPGADRSCAQLMTRALEIWTRSEDPCLLVDAELERARQLRSGVQTAPLLAKLERHANAALAQLELCEVDDPFERGLAEQLLAEVAEERGDSLGALEHTRAALSDYEHAVVRVDAQVLRALQLNFASVLMSHGSEGSLREAEQLLLRLRASPSVPAEFSRTLELARAELALRRGEPAEAAALMGAHSCEDTDSCEELAVWQVLEALVAMRLAQDPQQQDAAREQAARVAQAHDEALGDHDVVTWLATLGLSEAERSALGLEEAPT